MRSPEMLLATSSPTVEQQASLKHAASDVWALGCLLYELVTGAVLFPNELDWPKFFITVTDPTQVQAMTPVYEDSFRTRCACLRESTCGVKHAYSFTAVYSTSFLLKRFLVTPTY